MARVYGKGLNILKQLGGFKENFVDEYTPLESLEGRRIKEMHGGFFQSYFALDDGQIVYLGYPIHAFTTGRTLWYYKSAPKLFQKWQGFAERILGKDMTFNNNMSEPSSLGEMSNLQQFETGNCNLFCLKEGQVYVMGENTHGQLGANSTAYISNFSKLDFPNNEQVIHVSSGFSHTLYTTSNRKVYGCGKGHRSRIIPEDYHKTGIVKEVYTQPTLITKDLNVTKTAAGMSHSVFLTGDNCLYALGFNQYGQLGQNTMKTKEIKEPTEIFCYFAGTEKIKDVKCGFHHTLVMTDQKVYFMGSTVNNEFPFKQSFNLPNICSLKEVPLPGRPVKIFASFDRSAVLTEDNEVYVFGGDKFGNKTGELEVFREGVNPGTEVALGYGHTLISV